MSGIPFQKMHGAGNDFIVIDNRSSLLTAINKEKLVKKICPRRLGIGADGVIFIENDPTCDFAWDFYNADGSVAEMCGNGARCAARFAYEHQIADRKMTFRTAIGVLRALLTEDGACISLPDIKLPSRLPHLGLSFPAPEIFFVNSGVPHAVIVVEKNLASEKVEEKGVVVRYHPHFAPQGSNVDFMEILSPSQVAMRTYERGVEAETLACGTGAIACAVIVGHFYQHSSPVDVRTKRGEILRVSFAISTKTVTAITLSGPAVTVCRGTLG